MKIFIICSIAMVFIVPIIYYIIGKRKIDRKYKGLKDKQKLIKKKIGNNINKNK